MDGFILSQRTQRTRIAHVQADMAVFSEDGMCVGPQTGDEGLSRDSHTPSREIDARMI